MAQEDSLSYCLNQIKSLKENCDNLDLTRAEAIKFYKSDPSIVPTVKNRSQATTSDLFDVIEWVKPSIMEIFTSGEDIVSFQPETPEDVEPVKNLELLVNKQLKQKNQWFKIVHDFFTDGMVLGTGIIKYQWFKNTKTIDRDYDGLTDLELQAKQNDPKCKILSVESIEVEAEKIDTATQTTIPAVIQYNIKTQYITEDEFPLIEVVPPEDVGFEVTAREISETFVYHRCKYSKGELIRKYGKEETQKLILAADEDKEGNIVTDERFSDLNTNFSYDKEKKEFYVYECYYINEENSEPWLTVLSGDKVFLDVKNKYGKPPFHVFTPIRMSHRIIGLSFYDLLKGIMRQRTAITRQVHDNMYLSNFRRYFVDSERIVDMEDYYSNTPTNSAIRCIGDPNTVVAPEIKAPLPPEVFSYLELLNEQKDYHSGVPRSFQGVNSNILNETARGQNQQISQAGQRIQLLARLIAETVISPLINDVIDLNLKFLQKKTMVRNLNQWIEISPDNINGKFDIEVKVGLGTGDKSQQVSQLQQILGLYSQMFSSGLGVVTAQNVYHTMKELLRAMGYRNTSDFVTNPEHIEDIKALIQLVMQAAHATGQTQNPQIMAVVQKAIASSGIQPQGAGGGTLPGQNMPMQPQQPMNAQQHRGSAIDGGQYFA